MRKSLRNKGDSEKNMTKYKVRMSIDEKEYFWVIMENSKTINRNADRDELVKIKTKHILYNMTNICPICREENNITDKSILYPGNSRHETDKNGKKIDEYVCRIHGLRRYQIYDSNSTLNAHKLLAHRRTGNLNNSEHILGDNCQRHAYEWLGCEDLNKKNDNYCTPIDCSPIHGGISIIIGGKLLNLSGKVPQIKGRRYNPIYRRWATHIYSELGKKFDILILYCISEYGNAIDRIYIFPKEEIVGITGISITEHPTDNVGDAKIGWYEEYRVTGEDDLKKADKIWKNIILDDIIEGSYEQY